MIVYNGGGIFVHLFTLWSRDHKASFCFSHKTVYAPFEPSGVTEHVFFSAYEVHHARVITSTVRKAVAGD